MDDKKTGWTVAIIILVLFAILSVVHLRTKAELGKANNIIEDSYYKGVEEMTTKVYEAGIGCKSLDFQGPEGNVTLVNINCLGE